jgi:predicted O-methyltransferase YrrM
LTILRYELVEVIQTLRRQPRQLPHKLLGYARRYRQVQRFPRLERPHDDPEAIVDFAFSASNGLIKPIQVRNELLWLAQRVAAEKPRVVVEIGTARGGTLFVFAALADPEATIISIDLPGGIHGGGYPSWKQPLYRSFAREQQQIHLLRGDSHDPAIREQLERLVRGNAIDFLFIDGDHTYTGARADVDTYAPLVRPNGLIALHDICVHPRPEATPRGLPEVGRLWAELKASHATATSELVEDPAQGWAGIGLVKH